MNGYQRTMTVLKGEIPDRVPVCLHNFMMAVDESPFSMEDYLNDPQAAARVHIDAQAKYGHDCILLDLDTTLLAGAMGAEIDSAPGESGHVKTPAIGSLDEACELQVVDPQTSGRIPVLLETIRILRKEIGGEVAIRGNCDQMAFSLASLLRGMQEFMMDLLMEPDHPGLQHLLEISYRSHLAVHLAVMEAGADFTSVGDSPSGPDMISPDMYRRFAKPWHEKLIQDLSERDIFTLIHICGDTSAILEDLAELPRCAFELDYKTDAVKAKQTAGANHVLFGNIDPANVVGRGTAEQVQEVSRSLIELWKPEGNFIFNAGCGIPQGTPPENIEMMMRCAREYGSYA